MNGNANLNILVPTDFSALSQAALQVAIMIARPLQGSITLLRVIENAPFLVSGTLTTSTGLSELVDIAKRKLMRNAADLKNDYRLEVSCRVECGNPGDQICRAASEGHISLIVMGAQGRNACDRSTLGSTASRVVSLSPCSVMTIPDNDAKNRLQKILVPVRLVPHALNKFELVRTLVKSSNADVVIAGMMNRNEPGGSFNMESLLTYIIGKIEEVKGKCRGDIYYADDLAHQLLLIAEKESPDLIVITTAVEDYENSSGFRYRDLVNYGRFQVLNLRNPVREESGNRGAMESSLVNLVRMKIENFEKQQLFVGRKS